MYSHGTHTIGNLHFVFWNVDIFIPVAMKRGKWGAGRLFSCCRSMLTSLRSRRKATSCMRCWCSYLRLLALPYSTSVSTRRSGGSRTAMSITLWYVGDSSSYKPYIYIARLVQLIQNVGMLVSVCILKFWSNPIAIFHCRISTWLIHI